MLMQDNVQVLSSSDNNDYPSDYSLLNVCACVEGNE